MNLIINELIKPSESRKLIFVCFGLLLTMFLIQPTLSISEETIGFVKKEILYLKWGNGKNEVGLSKRTDKGYPHDVIRYAAPRSFGIDDDENIYIMDTINKRVQVFTSVGKFSRSIPCLDARAEKMLVGEDGEIYLSKYPNGSKKETLVRISKNDKRTEYKLKTFANHIAGNAIYSWDEKPLLEMTDKRHSNNEKPRKPRLVTNKDLTVDYSKNPKVVLKFEKINEYLKSQNKKGNFQNLKLSFPQKQFLNTTSRILGVSKNGDAYVGYSFDNRDGLQEQYIQVYSPAGILKNKVSLPLDELNPDLAAPFRVHMNDDADVYQMLISKDGVHIYKWSPIDDSKN